MDKKEIDKINALFCLGQYFQMMFKILDTVFSLPGYIIFLPLNRNYLDCLIQVDKIFKNNSIIDLEKKYRNLTIPKNIIQMGDDYKCVWEDCGVKENFLSILSLVEEKNVLNLNNNSKPDYFSNKKLLEIAEHAQNNLDVYIKAVENAFDKIMNNYKKFNYVIYKDKDEYYFGDQKINFKNKNTPYYKIFDFIYRKCPAGGVIKYDEIIKEMKKNGVKNNKGEFITMNTLYNVFKGRKDGIFRYSNLPMVHANGNWVISKVKGIGIEFKNPKR